MTPRGFVVFGGRCTYARASLTDSSSSSSWIFPLYARGHYPTKPTKPASRDRAPYPVGTGDGTPW
jgi:hypothetical protein